MGSKDGTLFVDTNAIEAAFCKLLACKKGIAENVR